MTLQQDVPFTQPLLPPRIKAISCHVTFPLPMAVTLSYPPEVSELQEGIDFFFGGGRVSDRITCALVPAGCPLLLCYSVVLRDLSRSPSRTQGLVSTAGGPPPASDKFKARAVPLRRCLRAVTILWAAWLLAPLPQ